MKTYREWWQWFTELENTETVAIQRFIPKTNTWQFVNCEFYKHKVVTMYGRAHFDHRAGCVTQRREDIFPCRIVPVSEEMTFDEGYSYLERPVFEPGYKYKTVGMYDFRVHSPLDPDEIEIIRESLNPAYTRNVEEGVIFEIYGDRDQVGIVLESMWTFIDVLYTEELS